MNIIFMGTPEFAVKTLEKLIENHNVTAVVTQPDKQKGRGKKFMFTPVKEKAIEHNIPVLQPINAKDSEFINELKNFEADIFVVAAYGQILTEELLFMPKFGSINVHGSILPEYRGAAPIQRAIIDGKNETGITIMYMEKGLDSGDMILKETLPIEATDTYGSLAEKMANLGGELLIKALEKIEDGSIIKEKQNHEKATYASMISKEMGHINWDMTANEISCLVRGLNPQPGAFTFYNEDVLKIWEVEVVENDYNGAQNGEIVEITKKGFIVKAGSGGLLIKVIQGKGGKMMPTDAYMRGRSIEANIILQ